MIPEPHRVTYLNWQFRIGVLRSASGNLVLLLKYLQWVSSLMTSLPVLLRGTSFSEKWVGLQVALRVLLKAARDGRERGAAGV